MYEVPSPGELREFLKRSGLTGGDAARLIGVDSRTVRKWTASEDADNRRSIPWSAWLLLSLYSEAIVKADSHRIMLNLLNSIMPRSNDVEAVGEVMSVLIHARGVYVKLNT